MRAIVLPLVFFASQTAAQPVVHVRAETRIELQSERDGTFVRFLGVLRDDLGDALPHRRIRVRVVNAADFPILAEDATTDADGRFAVGAELESGTYTVSARFPGDDEYERLLVERRVDLEREEVRLLVRVPENGRLDLDQPTHAVRVQAECNAGASGLSLELLDEFDRNLGRAVTDESGVAVFSVAASALGNPGSGRLKARTRGDAARTDAQTEVPIVRYRATLLTFASENNSVKLGESVLFQGSLRDSQAPLQGRAIGIYDTSGEHRATVLTNGNGEFEWEAEPGHEDGPALEVVARFASDGPGRESSESPVASVSIRSPAEARALWALVPMLLCLLALGLLRRREAADAPARSSLVPSVGIQRARPTRKRAASRRVAGRLVDHRDGELLTGELRAEGPTTQVHRVPGRFDLELPDGRWRITLQAPGYAPTEETISVPHHGEWEAIEARLESWRARALSVFSRFVDRWLPGRWSKATIHELRGELPARGNALGFATEQAFYGPDDPNGAVVASLERQSEDAGVPDRQPPLG
ncbi:MAG: carboxypeptidase-like regulatory domain-containing protein [Myxococcota bacterium]